MKRWTAWRDEASALLESTDRESLSRRSAQPAAFVASSAARCASWKSYDQKVRIAKKSPAPFSIRVDDWTGALELYARGDIDGDGDGDEDVLVRRDGGVDGGSDWGTALFLLSQTERDPCIRVVREFGLS